MTIKQQGGIFGRNPSFNEVEVKDISVTRTLANGENADVLIGSAGRSDVLATIAVARESTSTRVGWVFKTTAGAGNLATAFTATSDGNIAFPSGQGIDFSATSGTGTSELFDDYEEGTWTPTVLAYDGTPTTSGYYTKIGQDVRLEGSVQLDGTADPSVVRFSGFPFTVASPYLGGAYLTYNNGGVADVIINIDSSSRLELRNSSGTALTFNGIGVSALLTFVVSYRSA